MATKSAATPGAGGWSLFAGLRGVTAAELPREVVAGVTLAALVVPLNIGYAEIAGLPPVAGLYAALLPAVAFVAFSSSRQLVAGPDAAIAAVIGAVLATLAVPSDPRYAQLAAAQALLCGLLLALFWKFRLGFLANFLSGAVMVGFVTGLGIEIFTGQVPKILGVTVEAEGWFREVEMLIRSVPSANPPSLLIGVGTVAVIRVLAIVAPKIPGPLAALVLATAAVAVGDLGRRGVAVLGVVDGGLPPLAVPLVSPADLVVLLPGALAICAITAAEALLVGRSFAQRRDYRMDADQELLALGAANVAAAVSGGFALGASGSRTATMDAAGSRTQIPSLVSAVIIAAVLLFLTDALTLLPMAALGGIVANAALGLIEIDAIRHLWRVRRDEAVVAVTCALGVLVLGTVPGVVVAFLLSTVAVVRRASQPNNVVLGEARDEPGFVSVANHPEARTIPGIVVYRFGAPLSFANAQALGDDVERLLAETSPPVRWFVLDAEAITDIDSTGAAALGQTIAILERRGVVFAVARLTGHVRDQLAAYGLLGTLDPDRIFRTNQAAAVAFAGSAQASDGGGEGEGGGEPAPAGAVRG